MCSCQALTGANRSSRKAQTPFLYNRNFDKNTLVEICVVELLSVKLDEIDRKILEMLQENARTSFASIARKLKIAEATVRFRVKRLRGRGVITQFVALLDPRKIGLSVTAIIMLKVEPALLEKASEQLASFEEVHHVFQSTGEYDIVAVVHARDMMHLSELTKRVKMISGVKDALVSATTRLMKITPTFKL
jgi:Lrp/AsnC family transcriptional regulator for asnA, asnC and gidA